MITWGNLYTVLTAVVPLYVAMILAYGSVRWWGIFTPDQCSGINRFVALFAVPLLSFRFISNNDPYAMNIRFIAADTLQKIIVLVALSVWSCAGGRSRRRGGGGLDWAITLFSLSTLPNTLVMGIPLLIAMYGPFAGALMVQVVVLQCIVWYTLLLFLFEYRAAKALIADQFPDNAGDIVAIHVDPDVVSLDAGRSVLLADAEAGKIHVTVRKSSASRRSLAAMTPRPSNLTGAEIYSLSSSRNPTPRGSNFNHSDFYDMVGGGGPPPRLSSFGPGEYHPQHTPRPSNFDEPKPGNPATSADSPIPSKKLPPLLRSSANSDTKELHMFVWTSSASPASEVSGIPVFGGPDLGSRENGAKEIRMIVPADPPHNGGARASAAEIENGPEGLSKLGSSSTAGLHPAGDPEDGNGPQQMPPASVMTRLILIMVWRKLIRNPNTYSSLVGLAWSLVSFRWHVAMPKIVEKSISILSDAGLGMAMFSLGLFMALQPRIIACGNKVAAFTLAVRFLTGPAVMATAAIAVGVRGTLLHVSIVQAALPQGIVPFVFAKEYGVHPTILSTGVIFGMLLALPITLVYYIVLGATK